MPIMVFAMSISGNCAELVEIEELKHIKGMACECVENLGPCQYSGLKGGCLISKFEGDECDQVKDGPKTNYQCKVNDSDGANTCDPGTTWCYRLKEGTCRESRIQPIPIYVALVCDTGSAVPRGSSGDANGVPCF